MTRAQPGSICKSSRVRAKLLTSPPFPFVAAIGFLAGRLQGNAVYFAGRVGSQQRHLIRPSPVLDFSFPPLAFSVAVSFGLSNFPSPAIFLLIVYSPLSLGSDSAVSSFILSLSNLTSSPSDLPQCRQSSPSSVVDFHRHQPCSISRLFPCLAACLASPPPLPRRLSCLATSPTSQPALPYRQSPRFTTPPLPTPTPTSSSFDLP
ncbi:hypothetical protein ACLOJK_007558 [Asimina triloba]